MTNPTYIKRAQTLAEDERVAVHEFHAGVTQADMVLVVFFCSSAYRLELLAEEMRQVFSGVQVVGCTTAGEIGPAGYRDHSLSGASFSAAGFDAVSGGIRHLQHFETASAQALAQGLLQRLESHEQQAGDVHTFALLLTDGLSIREEPLTRSLQGALGNIAMLGGSAGDGASFGRSHVFFDGHFQTDSAVLTLISTRLPFKLFMTQHFVATDERLVVTEADTALRIVREINGRPAAQEYARMLGVEVNALTPGHFAASPMVVLINGTHYVRAIQKVNPDNSLTFFCAIDCGLVLRVGKGMDLLHNLEQAFERIHADIGQPQVVITCDCVLRKLEIFQGQLEGRVNEVFQQNNAIGFSTYGEQFHGVHVNQTLVGVAIGSDAAGNQHA
jgi:hypothetical protein